MRKRDKIRVYRNLNRNESFSVQRYEDGRGWIVQDYVKEAMLHECDLWVSPAGFIRSKKSGQRNVHAYIYCNRLETDVSRYSPIDHQINYNPFEYPNPTFMIKDKPIQSAERILLFGGRAYLDK